MALKPFVKWAGGKKQLLSHLIKHKPSSFGNYIEPFVGGGALLFELGIKNSKINDSNEELINCYNIIKRKPQALITDLKLHNISENYYYELRSKDIKHMSDVERASRFIFLNRTCFNGLWRVNKDNRFNTPYGKYKNPKIMDQELIMEVSEFLKSVEIYTMDFEKFLLEHAKKGDFVYLDPPYHPISKYSDFKRYTKDFFDLDAQKRLAKLFKVLDQKGCKLLLSNSYSKEMLDLYKDFKITIVNAKRIINKNPDGRGNVKEILVRNYEPASI
jgi:DNA adenine methylase